MASVRQRQGCGALSPRPEELRQRDEQIRELAGRGYRRRGDVTLAVASWMPEHLLKFRFRGAVLGLLVAPEMVWWWLVG